MRGFVAKGAGHPATTGGHHLDRQVWHQRQNLLHCRHRIEGFLMTMAMQQSFFLRQRLEFQLQAAGIRFARNKLLKQQCLQRQRGGVRAR